MKPPSARLCLALTASLLLHLTLLAGRLPAAAPEKPPRIEARLLIPESRPQPEAAPDPAVFEKNTLAPETRQPETAPPAPSPRPRAATPPARLKAGDEQRALRKLSEHILYPQAAVEAGHEGTVHLLLRLDAHGTILHASVAAGSGHPELDHAALQSALRAGQLNAGGRTEIILPITFRLQ